MDSISIFWLVLAVVMAVVEAVTVQLVSIWFVFGSLAACITSLFTDSIIIEAAVFVAVSALALAVTRPLVRKLKQTKSEPTNADRCIGQSGVVIAEINNNLSEGLVMVENNSRWSARSQSGEVIPVDTLVRVTDIAGVKLIVTPINSQKGI